MQHDLLAAMAFQVAWTAMLYVALTVARAPKIWGVGKRSDGSNPFAEVEPRISANLSNQFEWPMFFFAACILLMLLDRVNSAAVTLAWVFVVGRVLHSCVQILTKNIRLRGIIFTINFLAVLGMWVLLAWK